MVNIVSVLIKCVFIVVKIKYMNFDRINDICDKVNFTTNYTHFITPDIHCIKTYTNIIIFDTFNETVLGPKNFPKLRWVFTFNTTFCFHFLLSDLM